MRLAWGGCKDVVKQVHQLCQLLALSRGEVHALVDQGILVICEKSGKSRHHSYMFDLFFNRLMRYSWESACLLLQLVLDWTHPLEDCVRYQQARNLQELFRSRRST